MSFNRHDDTQKRTQDSFRNIDKEGRQLEGRALPSSHNVDQSAKPELLKNGKLKLFILLLCAVSFYAGWQASRSYLVKECHLAGAVVNVEDDLVYCSMP